VSTAVIVQARTGSTRLPAKVLRPLAGRPLLWHVIDRVRRARSADTVVVATTTNEADRPLMDLAREAGVEAFAGSEDNVLSRYIAAAESVGAETIVRVTSDCPLIDWNTIDDVVALFRRGVLDHAGLEGYPRGLDTEVVALDGLHRAHALSAAEPETREHVTLYMYRHPEAFRLGRLPAPPPLARPDWRLTVDEAADYELISAIYDELYEGEAIDIREVVALLDGRPDLVALNAHVRQKPA
jgi:spore coat polysaccharide biosynthesis protein SpsF